MLNLEGVNAKISRARECLQSLEKDIAAFCEYHRRRLVFEIEQELVTIIGDNVPGLSIDYSIRVGEIAYNLRSALDHLVWQLVIDNGCSPSRRNEFPIYDNNSEYEERAKGKLKGIHSDHYEVIETFQPYHGPRGVGAHLWMLRSICNIDKHRHLNVVALHSISNAHLMEEGGSELTGGMIGGLGLLEVLRGTAHEDKVEIEVIVDVCFMDQELEALSVGYGSAIEREGVKRPPVTLALSGCLAAVEVVVDRLASGFLLDKRMEPTR